MADSPNILVFPLKVAADGSIRGRCTAKNSRSRSSSAQVRDGMMGAGIGFSSSSSHSQFCPALPSRRKQQFADRRSLQASRCQPGCKARPTGVRQIHRAFALDERLECRGGLQASSTPTKAERSRWRSSEESRVSLAEPLRHRLQNLSPLRRLPNRLQLRRSRNPPRRTLRKRRPQSRRPRALRGLPSLRTRSGPCSRKNVTNATRRMRRCLALQWVRRQGGFSCRITTGLRKHELDG